jgi:hypothetical protein
MASEFSGAAGTMSSSVAEMMSVAALSPAGFIARTWKSCNMPFAKPVMMVSIFSSGTATQASPSMDIS